MEYDRLKLFNKKRADKIVSMSDEDLWNFLLENEERVKYLSDFHANPRPHSASGFLYAYPHGIDWFKKHFYEHLEQYREGSIYTIVIDFCFDDESVMLDYWARCGYLDSADSCDVKTSDEIMPPVDDDSEEGYYKIYFHLLETNHVENILAAMERNFDKLTENTRKDINKIKKMHKFCQKNEGFKIIYQYN